MDSTSPQLWTLVASIWIWDWPLILWVAMGILTLLVGCPILYHWQLMGRRVFIGRLVRHTLRWVWR